MASLGSERGSLELILGPMFSGKTDELIRRLRSAGLVRKNVVAVKPSLDVRQGDLWLVSHSGARHPATCVAQASQLPSAAEKCDLLAVDEVQFFDVSIVPALTELRSRGIRVVAAGLEHDFRRLPFRSTSEVRAVADLVTTLTSVCSLCGAPARFTQRVIDGLPAPLDDALIRVAGRDLYEPRCKACHRSEDHLRPVGRRSDA